MDWDWAYKRAMIEFDKTRADTAAFHEGKKFAI